MATATINKMLADLTPTSLVEMFIIDSTLIDDNSLPQEEQVIYIHNFITPELSPIYFNGQKYSAVPCKFTGYELKGDGSQLPRPRFSITNYNAYASRILRNTDSLTGAKITRKRTFAKFLNPQSWGENPPFWNVPGINEALSEDVFYVGKKTAENKTVVEFELATSLELNGIRIPKRRMFASACSFEYRNSYGCPYGGPPAATLADKKFETPVAEGGVGLTLNYRGEWRPDEYYAPGDYVYLESKNKKTESKISYKKFFYVCLKAGTIGQINRPSIDKNSWIADACSKTVAGCLCRYQQTDLRFGGFPSLSRVGFAE